MNILHFLEGHPKDTLKGHLFEVDTKCCCSEMYKALSYPEIAILPFTIRRGYGTWANMLFTDDDGMQVRIMYCPFCGEKIEATS